jgi:hypothetical protein
MSRVAEHRGEAGNEKMQALELRLDRERAARIHGLNDDEMATMLTGTSKEQIMAQAEMVAKYKAAAKPAEPADPAAPPAPPKVELPAYDAGVPVTDTEKMFAEADDKGW